VVAQMENEAGIVGAAMAALYWQLPADGAAARTEQATVQDMSEEDTSC
jgi:hypothetical protein